MKQPSVSLELVNVPPYLLLAVFNAWFAYAIAQNPQIRVSGWLAQYIGWPMELFTGMIVIGLLLTGVCVFIFAPQRIRWLIAGSLPLMLYSVSTAGILLTVPDRPGGSDVIYIMATILLFAYYSLHLHRQTAETTIHALSAEIGRLTEKLNEMGKTPTS